MTEYNIYLTALFATAIISAILAWACLRLSPQRLPQVEPLPRRRDVGVVLAFIALIWCVPHATPIVWGWMLPWLYPVAVVCAVMAYLFLDYLLSRALGGLLILISYYFLHESFTRHTSGAALLTILCWALGIAGIFISAKPHLMRDLIRRMCASLRWRAGVAAFFAAFSAIVLYAGIFHCLRG